jgi:hypothetical protein
MLLSRYLVYLASWSQRTTKLPSLLELWLTTLVFWKSLFLQLPHFVSLSLLELELLRLVVNASLLISSPYAPPKALTLSYWEVLSAIVRPTDTLVTRPLSQTLTLTMPSSHACRRDRRAESSRRHVDEGDQMASKSKQLALLVFLSLITPLLVLATKL